MPGGLLVEEPGELDHILISLVDGGWWGLNVNDAHLENKKCGWPGFLYDQNGIASA